MSELKLISPLLDGFSVGNPMSEHNGVRCYPAIKENTDKKYIVKVISVPASQTQMDALLLAGAYRDPADAMEYFQSISEDILKEAELLKTLSRLDGFLPYESWQIEPITRRRLGYEIYLAGSYKRSLEKYMKNHPVTHLEAVNLGLDMCAALTVCRDAGALYVALKPSNIFVSEKKEYRIGDLGFLQLDSLSYAALPEKYHSPYTPPELLDPMAAMNMTADTYALGMILYQLYNDGQLPVKELRALGEELPMPVNADYEIAEIIMKAVHLDPSQRWDDPRELGKALAAYMQRNTINDVPITLHVPSDIDSSDILITQTDDSVEGEAPIDSNIQIIACERTQEDILPTDITATEYTDASTAGASDAEFANSENLEDTQQEPTAPSGEETNVIGNSLQETESVTNISKHVSEDLSSVITKADDLISHQIPKDIVFSEPSAQEDLFSFVEDSEEDEKNSLINEPNKFPPDTEVQTSDTKIKKGPKFADPKYKRRHNRAVSFLTAIILFALLIIGGFWYYQNVYLIPIEDIIIDGNQTSISVAVDCPREDISLLVRCIDQFGKAITHGLSVDGKTSFTGLQPNTMYTIQVETESFHQLIGKTSDIFTTEANTTIVDFSSVVGSEDGSVVLSFAVNGEEPKDWTVFYSTEGGEEKRRTFSGHTVTINELSVGKVYTFRLDTGENIALGGQTTMELMASRLILAENIAITSDNVSEITITWDTPGDVVVDSWNIKCYNSIGFEKRLSVNTNQATFSELDPTSSYIIEITASGMTQSIKASISPNPVIIQSLNFDETSGNTLKMRWDYSGEVPEGGWLVTYNLAGGEKSSFQCKDPYAEISPKIPGAKYDISINSADGTTVFNSNYIFTTSEAESFEKHNLTADKIRTALIKTPEEDNWRAETIPDADFTETFSSGNSISIAMFCSDNFYLTGATVKVLYVLRDGYGNVLPSYTQEETYYWKDIWNSGDVKNGELTLPVTPKAPGTYSLELYFDGMIAAQFQFTIQ